MKTSRRGECGGSSAGSCEGRLSEWRGTEVQSPMGSLTRNSESTTECASLRPGEHV